MHFLKKKKQKGKIMESGRSVNSLSKVFLQEFSAR